MHQIKTESSFKPITDQQLAELHFLQQEIKHLHDLIYIPTSASVSIIATPLVIYLLFVSQYAPFHGMYLGLDKHLHDFCDNVKQRMLSTHEELKQTFVSAQKTVSKSLCESRFDFLSKQKCHNIFSSLQNAGGDIHKVDVSSVSKQLKISEQQVKDLISGFFDVQAKQSTEFYQTASAKAIQLTINKIMHYISILTGGALHRFIVHPLLVRVFFVRPVFTINPYVTYQKDEKDADNELIRLREQKIQLTQRSQYVKKISRYIAVIVAPVAIYNLVFAEETFPAVSLACLTTLSTVITEGWRDIKNWQKSLKIAKELSDCRRLLQPITASIKQDPWQTQKNALLEISYLWIKLKNYKMLGKYFLAEKLKYYLWKNGVISQNSIDNYVFISAAQILKNKNMSIIAEQFNAAVTRWQNIKTFKKQLDTILKKFKLTINLEVPLEEDSGLPTASFYILVDNLDSNLKEIFSYIDNKVDVEGQQVKVTGYQVFSEKRFQEILNKLNEREYRPATLNYQPVNSRKTLKMSFAKSQLIENEEESKHETTVNAPRKIYWGTDCYDPDAMDCPVKLMRPALLSQGRHFVTFKLKPHHMPKGYPLDFYQQLAQSTLTGKIGAENQGWKFISAGLCNDLTTGETQVPSSAKFRVFGNFGDMRLYARREVARTADGDKFLHRVVGLVPHAHRG